MKRVLVTGAGGFVGAHILDMWRGKFALCVLLTDISSFPGNSFIPVCYTFSFLL